MFLAVAIGTSLIVAALVSDLADRDEVQRLLTRQARRDPLTGLPNRVWFAQEMESELRRARRTGGSVGVVLFDLDHFKKVNDRFGHPTGDQVLVIVSELFEQRRRSGDLLARLSGDEFVLLCADVDEESLVTIARGFLDVLSGSHRVGHRMIQIAASAGVAASRLVDDSDGVDLLRRADIALYSCKRSRAGVCVFDTRLEADTERRAVLEDELRFAIARNELRLEFQPIVDARSEAIVSFEALIRWDSGRLGRVPPDEFIPIAEETGEIHAIGEWVLRTACAQVAEWRAQRGRPVRVGVNVSARQVCDPTLNTLVADVLDACGVPAEALTLEITETAIMDDFDASTAVVRKLREMGVRLSLDDFGTGFSSMTNVRQFPVDSIKIDRSFINGLGTAPEDTAIVASVVHLAHSFGIGVIAEGVETLEQREHLLELGCGLAQGYLWYRPLRPEAVAELPDQVFDSIALSV